MLDAINLLDRKNYRQARQKYILLLGRHSSQGNDIRAVLFNNIAFTDVLTADQERLPEADACSKYAFELMPWANYIKGTRGAVLVELGDCEGGMKLLLESLAGDIDSRDLALRCCCIGTAEARRGNLNQSRFWFARARTIDPECVLLEREAREQSRSVDPKPCSPTRAR